MVENSFNNIAFSPNKSQSGSDTRKLYTALIIIIISSQTPTDVSPPRFIPRQIQERLINSTLKPSLTRSDVSSASWVSAQRTCLSRWAFCTPTKQMSNTRVKTSSWATNHTKMRTIRLTQNLLSSHGSIQRNTTKPLEITSSVRKMFKT